ncbi:effector binding domain-containing protein [Clostridiaceae bacterium M8S5]|nr:effector binding domain-containing protein [Clostridiaceae bacterium M8S5]
MSLQTISKVSKNFNISTRTLRYYEQIGLLQSVNKDGYSYRAYDENAIIRLEQIIILRKLRIPLKQIKLVLQSGEAITVIKVFQDKLNELSHDINALSTIKSIIYELIVHLKDNIDVKISPRLLTDESLLKVIDSLSVTKINFKERLTMNNLNNANENLSKLTNVRIIFLPPSTVASIQFYCDEPEQHAAEVMDRFVKENNLCKIKPDLRHYGFNNPNPSPNTPEGMPDHGYEMWVTIPEDMVVPKPLTKKFFKGGLYAAHMIKMGNFHEWEWLDEWANNNDTYEPKLGDPICMDGCIEEHLNYINNVNNENFQLESMQLDLLIPIKEKTE